MCFFENVANLRGDTDCVGERETALACECLRQRLAFDKLHHDEVTAVRQVSRVEDHRRVRMAQLGHGSRFAKEAIRDVSISGELGFDDFYCDRAFEIQVGSKVNSAHATFADFAFYTKSAG